MKASIKEIAKKTGFSPATVSLALNNSELVKAQTKEMIKKVAKEVGYTPNPYARKLVLQRSGMLGLVVPTLRNVYYADLVHYINTCVRSANFGLVIATSDNSAEAEKKIIDEMVNNRVEGIMLAPVNVPNENHDYTENLEVPLIYTTAKYSDSNRPCIMSDLEQGIYEMTRAIIDSGCENIAFVTGYGGVDSLDTRETGFKRAAGDTKFSTFRVGKLGHKGGCEAAENILASGDPFDAVVCVDDMVASGVINAFTSSGIRVPEDIWVSGFDNSIFSKTAAVPITTVNQDTLLIAEKTVAAMLKMIKGEPVESVLLPCELIRRKSAGI